VTMLELGLLARNYYFLEDRIIMIRKEKLKMKFKKKLFMMKMEKRMLVDGDTMDDRLINYSY